ncbi:MAG TPA: hypothetical protein VLT61_12190 [Anaeromyxobacteraceae bacterium]|nr:hypothetical protein [Anaeromyxobacteraceae bacterium]
MRYPNEEGFIAAALAGLCQHSAAKAHYDVEELGARAVALGRATAKAYAVALDGEEVPEEEVPPAPVDAADSKPAKPAKPKPR